MQQRVRERARGGRVNWMSITGRLAGSDRNLDRWKARSEMQQGDQADVLAGTDTKHTNIIAKEAAPIFAF